MITHDDVRRHAMRRAADASATTVTAEPGHAWPHAERRRWACALNDYGWRCATSVGRLWLARSAYVRERCGAQMCIVDTARPGMRRLGEDSITTGADRA